MAESKMITIEQRAVGTYEWNPHEQARIERNLFAQNGEVWEALRFCKNRDGRHNRVHLVIGEREFVQLFQDAVKNNVFHRETVEQLRAVLEPQRDPFLDAIGICKGDGTLTENIDEELYGEGSV